MLRKNLIYIVLTVAFIVRLGYVLTLGEKLYWEDEYDYSALGQSLAEGRGYVNAAGEATAFRPVGYPLLLAALYEAGLQQPSELRLAQVVLGVIGVWLVYLLALMSMPRLFAVLAALYAALYPYFIFMTGTLLASLWFSVTLLAFVYLFMQGEQKGSLWLFGMSGIFLGISALSVTTAVVLAPAAFLWLIFKKKDSLRSILRFAAVFSAACFLIIAPWMLRNWQKLGVVQLSTNGGRNLWLGNNPASTINTGSDIPMPADLQARIEAASEVEADHIYSAEAKSFIFANPKRFILLSLKKGAALWRFDPSPTTAGYSTDPRTDDWVSVLSYTPILLLAIVAFFLAQHPQKREMLLWILFFALFTAVHAVYISKVRFRLPLDHFLIVMAGFAVYQLFAAREKKLLWQTGSSYMSVENENSDA
jgi:4-amino-4-deoxy-L-arabinose transferase-like glycosyltransferase